MRYSVRFVCLFVLAVVSPLLSMQAAESASLPADAEKVMAKYNDKIADIVSDALEDIEKERKSAIKDLAKQKKKMTKKGNLESALAIKAVIDSLEQPVEESTDEVVTDLFGAAGNDALQAMSNKGHAVGGVKVEGFDIFILSVDLVKKGQVLEHYPEESSHELAAYITSRNKVDDRSLRGWFGVILQGDRDRAQALLLEKLKDEGTQLRLTARIAGKVQEIFNDDNLLMFYIRDLPE